MLKTPYEIIDAKKNKKYLSYEDIESFVNEYVKGTVSPAQMAAFLMAVRLNGMSLEETTALTNVMAKSGSCIDTSSVPPLLDKHSTGGVGDKTTFIVGACLNSLGHKVGMMSGRGLGHTGGTLDKLESVEGFESNIDEQKYLDILSDTGFAIISQTDDIAPADKLMYALRNETSTIDSIPLIAASIMSKKIASGTHNIVLDVKYGDGAFIKDKNDAEELARIMVGIAKNNGMKAIYELNSMDDVLGSFVGNAMEIEECLEIMDGKLTHVNRSLVETSLSLATDLASLVDDRDRDIIYQDLDTTLYDGRAKSAFLNMLTAQGGIIENRCPVMPTSPYTLAVNAKESGTITKVDVEKVGLCAAKLGANRIQITDIIYHDIGLEVLVHLDDAVVAGSPIAYIKYGNLSKKRLEENSTLLNEMTSELASCWHVS